MSGGVNRGVTRRDGSVWQFDICARNCAEAPDEIRTLVHGPRLPQRIAVEGDQKTCQDARSVGWYAQRVYDCGLAAARTLRFWRVGASTLTTIWDRSGQEVLIQHGGCSLRECEPTGYCTGRNGRGFVCWRGLLM